MSMKMASKLGGAAESACASTQPTASSTITVTPVRLSPRCRYAASHTLLSSSSATHVASGTWAAMSLGSVPAPSPRNRHAGEVTAPSHSRPASASAANDLRYSVGMALPSASPPGPMIFAMPCMMLSFVPARLRVRQPSARSTTSTRIPSAIFDGAENMTFEASVRLDRHDAVWPRSARLS